MFERIGAAPVSRAPDPHRAAGRPPAVPMGAASVLALQRAAGNRTVRTLLRSARRDREVAAREIRPAGGAVSSVQRVPLDHTAAERALAGAAAARRLDRCGLGGCSCGGRCKDELLEEERDGKGWAPDQDLEEELEGRARLSGLRHPDRRALQRLKITQYKFESGDCGKRNVQWVFALDSAAPEDGYIVQHIQTYSFVKDCPEQAIGPPGPEQEYWEAWLVKKGDKLDWTTVRDSWTDGSVLPVADHKNGSQESVGTVKFFLKKTTGDLGDFGAAPADPKSDWGPGKVPRSGALPSTAKKPSWWDNAPTEGPADRQTWSQWDCCDADPKKHTSTVTSKPTP